MYLTPGTVRGVINNIKMERGPFLKSDRLIFYNFKYTYGLSPKKWKKVRII